MVEYHDGADELAQRQTLLRHMQSAVEALPALEHAPAAARPVPTALLSGATDALAAAAMQSAVQAMASQAGVELASMETLPAEARGTYRRIGLRVSLTTSWPVLIELLRAADQGQPRMLVDDIQLHTVQMGERTATTSVGASFTLLAFRAPKAETPGELAGKRRSACHCCRAGRDHRLGSRCFLPAIAGRRGTAPSGSRTAASDRVRRTHR